MHLRPSLAALLPLSICLLSAPSALAKDEETVSVYLPGYNEKWWSDMYGSVISKVGGTCDCYIGATENAPPWDRTGAYPFCAGQRKDRVLNLLPHADAAEV